MDASTKAEEGTIYIVGFGVDDLVRAVSFVCGWRGHEQILSIGANQHYACFYWKRRSHNPEMSASVRNLVRPLSPRETALELWEWCGGRIPESIRDWEVVRFGEGDSAWSPMTGALAKPSIILPPRQGLNTEGEYAALSGAKYDPEPDPERNAQRWGWEISSPFVKGWRLYMGANDYAPSLRPMWMRNDACPDDPRGLGLYDRFVDEERKRRGTFVRPMGSWRR